MTDNTGQVAIGIDVGGTAIKGGVVTPAGDVLCHCQIDTEAGRGVDHVISRMAALIEQFRGEARSRGAAIKAVGLGMPGTLSRRRGMVIAPPNLPGWRDIPVVERLSSATGLSVILDNDANNAALGEYACGAGQGIRDMVLLTLGTGIGGGLILDGRLWRGYFENAGELGHMIVHVGGRRCACGQSGCLEAYSSANSVAARMVERIEAGQNSCLKHVYEAGEPIRAEMVIDAAEAGDEPAQEVWQETCRYLAIACVNLQHLLNFQRIVLSGGLSAAGDKLRIPVTRWMEDVSSKMLYHAPEVRIAALGNNAGFIGSAISVFLPA